MIFPIIILTLTLIGGGIAFFLMKRDSKKKEEEINKNLETAQEFMNVQDIKGNFLYSEDGYIFAYIKINPISTDLLSRREKESLSKTLTVELSTEQKTFRFLAVSRPVDITPLIQEYSNIILNTDNLKQKEILRHEMLVMSNYAMSGEVVERQFYIRLYEKFEEGIERDLLKRINELASKFEGRNIGCEILKEQGIIRLCNLINNPAYSHIEDTDFEAAIPFIARLEEGA
ncbi:hypothetical protein KQI88_10405 [Alkaliphilus sp. MSJ-5]|uniref:Uncharacterized protein n=1 Tax=Alkaliphilus flagellatus TaxID=2841507 RepID=A0ABS6G5Y3_9FIRM|nr:hypothetical protein [Alkaliphilus flagellatus]MBU5676830.1 hypothetical protein [Alkaliphilus flagellatus]